MTQGNDAVDVTIVMPCLNEERTLPQCIAWAREALDQLAAQGLTGEILISDNGSTDTSIEIAQSSGCRVAHCPQKGYGRALIFGIRAARGRYIVMGDSDASYDFRESVPMVLKLREGFSLCMGNRFAGEIKPGAMPWKNRRIGNPALSGILNLFFRSGLGDAHCGLRAFTKDAFSRMHMSSPGMEFASEMVVKAALLDLPRTEVPITLYKDGRDRPPHLRPLSDGWRHLKFLFMFSPLWLYFIPALALLGVSVTIFALLLATPRNANLTLGPFWIGDHWMILAGGLFGIGHTGLIFGLAALAYSVRGGFRKLTPRLQRVYDLLTIENAILFGGALFLIGAAIFVYMVVIWKESNFGFYGVSRIREMVVSTTLMVAGIQTTFGGFLVSLLRERRLFDRGPDFPARAEAAAAVDPRAAHAPGRTGA
jgi:glycosyltransferase involved in cell wall biosynthesis